MSLLASLILLSSTALPGTTPGSTDGRATKTAPNRPDPRIAALIERLLSPPPPPGPFHRTRILQTILWPEKTILDETLGPYLEARKLARAIRVLMEEMKKPPKFVIPRPGQN
jgi:hypothetical protein